MSILVVPRRLLPWFLGFQLVKCKNCRLVLGTGASPGRLRWNWISRTLSKARDRFRKAKIRLSFLCLKRCNLLLRLHFDVGHVLLRWFVPFLQRWLYFVRSRDLGWSHAFLDRLYWLILVLETKSMLYVFAWILLLTLFLLLYVSRLLHGPSQGGYSLIFLTQHCRSFILLRR